ncbi:PhzF family phenazine biosynthesis protein [Methylobacterium aerolatum]|uniref:Trans-2,3-dihydro-3-hydroxyanthranilate isomerase n=1 Tax=Methylobacterium aerolatum TaxID=418708 RepID=A0ABU0I5A9_9HYPH|nr:PhzF family phenazine biosynthesis protein [Methylobacterium aerolatum]MDQ0449812.1 trans-2,3-dihydro-3-hydroxyanthranilate isomerase [Methylobacterium aerolatum]GJD36583.1 Trans-2,3-dihydro-3-hydroxyanthranilate isomerase [Methylobacterium aerolatum]
MTRRFATLDVFTTHRLAGNPLAVVLDSQGLDGAAMQAIAREFNLSETVFVLPPSEPRHRARLRIFTPARELPFAGHPTVGTAVFLAMQDPPVADARAFGLEEEIGIVPCIVETLADGSGGRARFRLPTMPEELGPGPEPEALAARLGLAPGEIGFGAHRPSRFGTGPRFTCVPVASVERLDGIRPAAAPEEGDGLYLYAPDPDSTGLAFRTRMFAPQMGIAEDPATGAAAAAFAGVLRRFEALGEGSHDVAILQGQAMGRPSRIDLQVTVLAGALHGVEIGGAAVLISEGVLRV